MRVARLGIWRKMERVMDSDRSGSVAVADLIKMSRPLEKLNHVGLAELIWWERRKFVHGEVIQRPERLALSIATLATNYQRATKRTVRQRVGWKKPPAVKLSINVDGSSRGWRNMCCYKRFRWRLHSRLVYLQGACCRCT